MLPLMFLSVLGLVNGLKCFLGNSKGYVTVADCGPDFPRCVISNDILGSAFEYSCAEETQPLGCQDSWPKLFCHCDTDLCNGFQRDGESTIECYAFEVPTHKTIKTACPAHSKNCATMKPRNSSETFPACGADVSISEEQCLELISGDEVCYCRGDFCNEPPKPEEKKPKKSEASVLQPHMILLFSLFLLFC